MTSPQNQTPLIDVLRDVSNDLKQIHDRMQQSALTNQESGLLSFILTQASMIFADLVKADGEQKIEVYINPVNGIGYPVFVESVETPFPARELFESQVLKIPSEPIEAFFGKMYPPLEADELTVNKELKPYEPTSDPLDTALAFDSESGDSITASPNYQIDKLAKPSLYELAQQGAVDLDSPYFSGGDVINMAPDWPNQASAN